MVIISFSTTEYFSQILIFKSLYLNIWNIKHKENRIYIRGESTRKKCKTAILLYCFHTAGVLHIFMQITFWALQYHFIENLKINAKRKPNYKIGWFHNWPMIISLYKRWFSVITINKMMFFIHLFHYKVYLTTLKNLKLKWRV